MALCEVKFYSETLSKQVAMNVIVPDKGNGPFPTYYLLHGRSDDYTIWLRRSRIEWYVRDMPMVVVMPDGYRGFYTDNEEGDRYATFFSIELLNFVERIFPVKRARAGRAVGGLSMGGYGALRLALGYPDKFISANSHSGALLAGTDPRKNTDEFQRELRRIFGARPAGSDHDLMALARKAVRGKQIPKIQIDCGVDDFLIEHNRKLHAHLKSLKIPHDYQEFPGNHEWGYWDRHVRDAIKFHAAALKLRVPNDRHFA